MENKTLRDLAKLVLSGTVDTAPRDWVYQYLPFCLSSRDLFELGVINDATVLSRSWGPWRLDFNQRVLRHGDTHYEVDLDECCTAAEVLDWIAQITPKTWADDAVIANLVRALNDLLWLQHAVCPNGKSRRCRPAQVLAARRVQYDVARNTLREWLLLDADSS